MARREIRVKVGGLSDAIRSELEKFSTDVNNIVNQSAENAARSAASELRKTSPTRSGRRRGYARGWTWKRAGETPLGTKTFVVHNRSKPGLTHLLEKGHAIAYRLKGKPKVETGERTRAFPHIEPASVNAAEQFEKEVLDGLDNRANR